MRTYAVLAFLACSTLACSSTSSSGATCVEATPSDGDVGKRTVDGDDPSCASDADCNVRCTCANGLGYTFVSTCHDGVCAQSASSCKQTCTENGSTMGSLGSATSTSSSSPCARTSSTGTTEPAPAEGSSAHGSDGAGTTSLGGESSSSPPQIYCANAGENQCYCGHDADYSDGSTSCTGATCCASTGWPSTGQCGCFERACDQVSSDTCTCGFAKTSTYPHPASCAKPADGVCCTNGSTCACHARTNGCGQGETVVSSCSLSILSTCESTQTKVASCH